MQLTGNEKERERETRTHFNFTLMTEVIGTALCDSYF